MNLRRNRPGTKAADLWNWYDYFLLSLRSINLNYSYREQEDIANMHGPFAV